MSAYPHHIPAYEVVYRWPSHDCAVGPFRYKERAESYAADLIKAGEQQVRVVNTFMCPNGDCGYRNECSECATITAELDARTYDDRYATSGNSREYDLD